MTLRSSGGSPFDPLTLTEWRNTIATWVGVPYSSQNSSITTELDRMIDEAHDYISKRKGHDPWTQREATFTLAASTATASLGYDVRTLIDIAESYSGNTQLATITTKRDYLLAWGKTPRASHPWDDQNKPYYYFDGMTSDNPPKQQWKRVPTPDATVSVTYVYHPYFELLASGSYAELPAHAVAEIRAYIKYRWQMEYGDQQKAMGYKSMLEDELRASSVADDQYGASLHAIGIELPAQFQNEMNLGRDA